MPRVSVTDRYIALGHWIKRRVAPARRLSIAVRDELGLWHTYPEGHLSHKPVGFHVINGLRRIAISSPETGRNRILAERELLSAKLEAIDLYYRLRRQSVRHEAEKRLVAAADRRTRRRIRDEAEKRIGLFSQYSHDLKTPLSMLTVPLEQMVIEDNSIPVKLRLQLEKIRTAIYSVLRTVTHSLDAARLVTRRQKPMLIPQDLTVFVRQVAEVYSLVFESYGISLKLDLESAVIAEIHPIQFEKILNNLLSNALKHNMPGGEIIISLKNDDRRAILSISDSGLGPGEDTGRRRNRNPWAFSSHGYGLSIVRELVRLNRGTMQFNSRTGVGTTVVLSLPASPELAPAAQSARRHSFDFTMHEVELMAAERNALSRRRRSGDLRKV
ncbi:MAG: sensor histidine kinase [Spirochaetota bacterium]